ncbi:Uncharacterised protein [BD1-7 clade bacterium]|uniref:Potassium channel domain-containing protein n=1 Tax=BD1-7 clade bacterium TaxID=2029982 RepID=A0A5S9MTK5_9GAMM|nr:Uncharacterised protein [BD1-7 clade bacterium]
MPVLARLRKLFLKHFMDMRWYSVGLTIAFYVVTTYLLLWLVGERALISGVDYFYWLIVTASTVGYGDLSPVTPAGKLIVAFFVIPFGLGLFALVIGRIATFVSFHWRKGVQGLKSLSHHNHILVIGWNEKRTLHLLRLLLRESAAQADGPKIALAVMADIINPLPDEIGFVRVESFTNDEDMARAGLAAASCIIIDNPDDDVTMTTALYCTAHNPDAHTIAYFQQDGLDTLLKSHCPNIECMPSVAVEMMAKSAMDRGSSVLHHELLSADEGMTQFSMPFHSSSPATVEAVMMAMKKRCNATLIGISSNGIDSIALNPAWDELIQPQSTLYYIAEQRIRLSATDWSELDV